MVFVVVSHVQGQDIERRVVSISLQLLLQVGVGIFCAIPVPTIFSWSIP